MTGFGGGLVSADLRLTAQVACDSVTRGRVKDVVHPAQLVVDAERLAEVVEVLTVAFTEGPLWMWAFPVEVEVPEPLLVL